MNSDTPRIVRYGQYGWLFFQGHRALCVALLLAAAFAWNWLAGLKDRRRRSALRRSGPRRALSDKLRSPLGWGNDAAGFVGMPRKPGKPGAVLSLRYPAGWSASERQLAGLPELIAQILPGVWAAGEHDHLHSRLHYVKQPEIPPLPQHLPFADLDAGHPDRLPIGVSTAGPVMWDLHADPHMLLAGRTGSGKSALLRLLIAQLAGHGGSIDVLDPKRGDDFECFESLPNIRIWTEPQEMADVVAGYAAEMDDRFRRLDKRQRAAAPRRVLVVDEAADFVAACREISRQPEQNLQHIIRQGRAARMHVLLAAQQANAVATGSSESRGQYGMRIGLGRLDASASMMLFGVAKLGVDVTRIPGRGVLDGVEPCAMHCAWLDDPAARRLALAGAAQIDSEQRNSSAAASPSTRRENPAAPQPACATEREALSLECGCGRSWSSRAKPGSTVRCPGCRKSKRVPISARII